MTAGKNHHDTSYQAIMDQDIAALWQQRDEGFLLGKAKKRLFWISLTSPHNTKAVVVVNGRVETAWKYQELFYHLFNLGYDVYSFDHRGQGLSERLTEDRQVGHVERFSDYVDDCALLIDSFKLEKYEHRFLLAHSMGGAIATRYIQTHSNHIFDGLVLSAPMFGVNLSPIVKPLAPYWACIVSYLSQKPTYLTENTTYKAKPFEGNHLTSSHKRYKWFRELYQDMPQLQLGGPSARWVWQSLLAAKTCINNTDKVTIPILLLQAQQDVIVCNQDQLNFTTRLKKTNVNVILTTLKDCKHEVLFERDEIRNKALEATQSFFAETSISKEK